MNGLTLRLVIRGRVQGVGYRDWAVREARRLSLSGWVRNQSDGTVEALISGAETAVEEFVVGAGEGPPSARVTGIERTPATPPESPGFRCLPSG